MPTTKLHRAQGAGVGLLVAAAIVGGGYSAKQLTSSSAGSKSASEQAGALQAKARAAPRKGVVPFLGPFRLGDCGPSVRLLEGALRRVGVRKTAPQACFGPATRRQVKHYQVVLHYRPTGVYNLVTHLAVVKHHGYNQEARRDLLYIAHLRYVARVHAAVLVATGHAHLVGGRLPYSQSGSRQYFPPWPRIPPATDCSGYVTWVLWQAGIGPAVAYFGPGSPVGWTGTLDQQGVFVPRNRPLQVGDLIFYGGGRPWGHVAIYVGHGRVSSHGSVGVKDLPYNYRAVGEVRRYVS